jgi:hypothetical protein
MENKSDCLGSQAEGVFGSQQEFMRISELASRLCSLRAQLDRRPLALRRPAASTIFLGMFVGPGGFVPDHADPAIPFNV